MKKIIPMLFTPIGSFLSMGIMTPALITSDIPIPLDFVSRYLGRNFYGRYPSR